MFGKLLSSALKVVTLPIDVANAAVDIVTMGDGTKKSRTGKDNFFPTNNLEQFRDKIADELKKIDE